MENILPGLHARTGKFLQPLALNMREVLHGELQRGIGVDFLEGADFPAGKHAWTLGGVSAIGAIWPNPGLITPMQATSPVLQGLPFLEAA